MSKALRSQPKTNQRPIPVWVMAGSIVLLAAIAVLVYFFRSDLAKVIQFPTRIPTATPTPAPDMSVDDAFFLFGEKGVVFLDIRPSAQWKAYRIQNSVNIPADELSGRLGELNHTDTIVVFDTIGGEGALKGYDLLKQAGFSSVFWVRGGMEAWVQRKYPLVGTAPY